LSATDWPVQLFKSSRLVTITDVDSSTRTPYHEHCTALWIPASVSICETSLCQLRTHRPVATIQPSRLKKFGQFAKSWLKAKPFW
ncbi:22153_t:CDS:2, partial [Dentiscutata erythropus]